MRKYSIALAALPVLLLAACDMPPAPSVRSEQAVVEGNQQRLVQTIPAPQLQTSLERLNIKRRLETLNKENQTSYIYLLSYGNVMAYYTVSGKVSSLNTYMVPSEQIINDPHGDLSAGSVLMEAPDIDGTYGQNANGIFFFTTEGAYVEWKGDYLWSDQPLRVTQPVQLQRSVE